MANESAGEEGDADFGKRSIAELPCAAIERIHVLTLSGEHTDGHTTGEHFSIGGQITTNSKQRLAAALVDAEAGDHFVEDQRGPGIFGDRANFFQECDRLQVRMAALYRLD